MAQLAAGGLPALQEAMNSLQLMQTWSRTPELAYTMVNLATTQLYRPAPSLPVDWQRLLDSYAKELLKLHLETRTWLALARYHWEDEATMQHFFNLIQANVMRYGAALDLGYNLMMDVRAAKVEQERHEQQRINTVTEGGTGRSSNGEVEPDPQQQGRDVEGEGGTAA